MLKTFVLLVALAVLVASRAVADRPPGLRLTPAPYQSAGPW